MCAGSGLIPWDHRAAPWIQGGCGELWWDPGVLEHPWILRGAQSCSWTLPAPLRLCPGAAGARWAAAELSLLAWEPRAPLSGGAEQPLLMAGDGAGSSSLFPPAEFQPQLQLLGSQGLQLLPGFIAWAGAAQGCTPEPLGSAGLGWRFGGFVLGSLCPFPGE